MINPICQNQENLDFIEDNLDELSKSIGSLPYIDKYYINIFKYEKTVFNLEAFLFSSCWFGYRKMYVASFFISLICNIIRGAVVAMVAVSPLELLFLDSPKIYEALLVLVGVTTILITLLILGGIANYIYFLSLKNRVLNNKKSKYGKSIAGVFGGLFFGILGVKAGNYILQIIGNMLT